VILFLSALSICNVVAAPSTNVTAGVRRMTARIDEILKVTDPMLDPYRNDERAEALKKQAASAAPNSREQMMAVSQLIVDQLRAGDMEDSLKTIEELRQIYKTVPRYATPANVSSMLLAEALDYLRIGEVENCLSLHGPDACILPFQGTAFHKKQRGSREAIRILTELLNKKPTDLKLRWLLNLAYMTLAEYPDKVPAQWLIPPRVFNSEYDIKRFVNIANPLGLEIGGLAGGVVADDFDGDGNIDIMASNWAVTGKMRMFHNNGDGSFSDVTEDAGLEEARGGLNMIQADFNNDGFVDVLVLRGAWRGAAGNFPKSLLKNNGDGTFSDVSFEAGLATEHPTQAAVWLDYDNDGWIDLFVGNESTVDATNRCELFHNNHDGTFTDVAAECGLDIVAFVKGVTAGDFNNDGRVDLYLSCGNEPNRLLRNDGAGKGGRRWVFTDVTAQAGVAEPIRSFPTWFFDFDNDGLLDIFVAGSFMRGLADVVSDYLGEPHDSERLRLWRNKGDGTFEDVTRAVNLYKLVPTMGCNFGDLDNDGFLDFYCGTGDPDNSTLIPKRMFRNDGGKRFQDVTTSGGFGHLQKGHAVAFADFDNDGDQDVYTILGGAYTGDTARSAFFENPGHGNHWIKLKIEGVKSNRAGIGARIKLVVETSKGPRTIYKTVNSGGSFGSNPLRQEIGLGDATAIRAAEIFWPVTGTTESISDLKLDRAYIVREGTGKGTALELKSYRFTAAKPAG